MGHDDGTEDQLLCIFRAAFRRRKGLTGPGDDFARLFPGRRSLVVHVDQVVGGVHAPPGASPQALARKVLRRALSDLAAAGARPWATWWTVAAPPRLGGRWMERLARAFLREARRFDVAVVGGDLTAAPALVLTCAVVGIEGRRQAPGRGGARPGDWLLVTGRLGGAVRSGGHMRPRPRLEEGRRLVQLHGAHAVMDISDGLACDLRRMLEASRSGARVDLARLPLSRGLRRDRAGWRSAVGEGEDYELLAALAPRAARRALRDPRLRRSGLTAIGEVTARRGILWHASGRPVVLRTQGWVHRWK